MMNNCAPSENDIETLAKTWPNVARAHWFGDVLRAIYKAKSDESMQQQEQRVELLLDKYSPLVWSELVHKLCAKYSIDSGELRRLMDHHQEPDGWQAEQCDDTSGKVTPEHFLDDNVKRLREDIRSTSSPQLCMPQPVVYPVPMLFIPCTLLCQQQHPETEDSIEPTPNKDAKETRNEARRRKREKAARNKGFANHREKRSHDRDQRTRRQQMQRAATKSLHV